MKNTLPSRQEDSLQKPSHMGWLGRLSLSFEKRTISNDKQKTVLVNRYQVGPLTVQRPFYPEGKTCHMYLLHPPGGIVGGDRLELDLNLHEDSHVLMTMPGATKFYRSETTATLQQNFVLAEKSTLEWLPQETILFSGANAEITTTFTLHQKSTLLGWETLCFGRPVMNEQFEQGNVKNRLHINIQGKLGVEEHLVIEDAHCAAIHDYTYSSTFFAYPANEIVIDLTRSILKNCPVPSGATCVDDILLIRLLANDNLVCQQYFHKLWNILRPHLVMLDPCPPRIWAT